MERYIEEYTKKMMSALDKNGTLIIGYDFDDTIFPSNFDYAITYVEEVRQLLRDLKSTGKCRFILITCREGDALREAEQFLHSNQLPYNSLNANLADSIPTNPRKVYCNIMIDDKCGLPMSVEILKNVLKLIQDEN